jgi:hypothetical protein
MSSSSWVELVFKKVVLNGTVFREKSSSLAEHRILWEEDR